ncbi:CoB--CoM heterodisulfide reductase iron-sulfur subunit B family protein [Gammaproteobacteria bacterium]|nr:CoB--CoM heterodisulfide reductase iron-sulfur subunit B family protein [Gammaproteobacteria bacterium]
MAKYNYSFYPGCSSERKASASNYMVSVASMCNKLDIELNEIPDWNCCGASIGFAEGGELPRHVLNARNIALSEKHNQGQDIVASCAACWLGTKESSERLSASDQLLADTKEVLKEAGLDVELKNETPIRHMVEALIEDVGYEELKAPVVKPLENIKFAGYVGCQTNRPFGIDGESYENPMYLDKMVETVGGEAITNYEKKVTCCGGALAFSETEKSQRQIKDIVESAYDQGADIIVTPCPVCQMNVEIYQEHINKKYSTRFDMPVTYYSQLLTVAYGGNVKEAGLNGNIIRARKLEEIASK